MAYPVRYGDLRERQTMQPRKQCLSKTLILQKHQLNKSHTTDSEYHINQYEHSVVLLRQHFEIFGFPLVRVLIAVDWLIHPYGIAS